MTEFSYCWHLLDVGSTLLVSDSYIKRYKILVRKTVKTVTNISNLSPTHFISNIRRQHRCSHFEPFKCVYLIQSSFSYLDQKCIFKLSDSGSKSQSKRVIGLERLTDKLQMLYWIKKHLPSALSERTGIFSSATILNLIKYWTEWLFK